MAAKKRKKSPCSVKSSKKVKTFTRIKKRVKRAKKSFLDKVLDLI